MQPAVPSDSSSGEKFTPTGARSIDVESRRYQIFPVLSAEEINRLRRFGTIKRWQPGEMLFEAGKPGPGMFVVLAGRVVVSWHDGMGHEVPVADEGPGEFSGEVGTLSGRPAPVSGRAVGAVETLLISPESLRALILAEVELGARIMRALILRRVALIESGSGGPVLIGNASSADMVRLQGFLTRNSCPHTVLNPDTDQDAAALVKLHSLQPQDLPLVVFSDGTILKRPSEADLGRRLGMLPELSAERVYDVIVVGAGPAGLATAVYAASEGLSVLVLDARAFGGQAGASARIENYLGFPTGISGQALAGRAFVQAQKFGAEIALPADVERLTCGGTSLTVNIAGGSQVRARTVVVASGAQYRRPQVQDLAAYEGRGIHYWASPIEAKLCRSEEVVLVGGGNSAGQAVVFLAGYAERVHLLVRGSSLKSRMSSYLVERIASIPNVEVHTETEITMLEGDDGSLSGVTWRHRKTITEVRKPIRHLFLFVGADPNTGWLKECGVLLDAKGFVLTGAEFADNGNPNAANGASRYRLPLETSVPGVFAIGDVRAGSAKRVAAAVGEGAAVVAQLHTTLAVAEARD
jgi:thioredoxin reductase (NADPH)